MTEVQGLYLLISLLFVVSCFIKVLTYEHNEKHFEGIKKILEEIKENVGKIVESQRLSIILKFDQKDLKVDLEEFEAKKEFLKDRVWEVLVSNPTHPNPVTLAYMILEQIGIPLFVSGQTRLEIQNALGRLIANGEKRNDWLDFLKEVIDQL